MAPFLIARNVDLDYTRREECRSKVDALVPSLSLSLFLALRALTPSPRLILRERPTFIARRHICTRARIRMDARIDEIMDFLPA